MLAQQSEIKDNIEKKKTTKKLWENWKIHIFQRLNARIKNVPMKIWNFNVSPADNLKNTYGSTIA